MKINPENDGIDHINIYSKAKTELGRLLSNFAFSPIDLKDDGKFNSIEAYWYWLLCDHANRDKLRETWGFEAKQVGRDLRAKDWPPKGAEDFEVKIKIALLQKAESHKKIQELIIQSELPFKHYYVYDKKMKRIDGGEWLVEAWEHIRSYFKELAEVEKQIQTKS
jgi:hypothetical protein